MGFEEWLEAQGSAKIPWTPLGMKVLRLVKLQREMIRMSYDGRVEAVGRRGELRKEIEALEAALVEGGKG